MNHTDVGPSVARRDDRDASAAADLPIDLDRLAGLLAAALAHEGVPAVAEVSLQLVSETTIGELNEAHLGSTGPTDVLSFPLDGVDGPSTDDEAWMVGDVVVCPAVAALQAPTHAGDLDAELALLVVHAALHLCGWDHGDSESRDAMWARERELMEALGCMPARDPWVEAGGSS